MKTSGASDQQFFDALIASEPFRRLKADFDPLLPPHLHWWAVSSGRQNDIFSWDASNASFSRKVPPSPRLFSSLKKHKKETAPFTVNTAGAAVRTLVVPLVSGERFLGHLWIHGFDRDSARMKSPVLNVLAGQAALAVRLCEKQEELNRLSASIRPRAIALSTVHTVHRIINSTLNLDELVSRLAHLTAQVLRANRCAIYLVENASNPRKSARKFLASPVQPTFIVCKACVGYSKKARTGPAFRIRLGIGLEGNVAKNAKIILRKNKILVPLIDEDVIGVMHVSHRKDKREFTTFDQEILTTLAEEAVIAIKNAQLYEEQKKVTLGTIQSLAVILGTRVENIIAPETFLRLALKMAEELKLGEDQTQALHYATLLKDTAKIGIPDEILKKPTKLTGEEYRLLREHPMKGAQIVQSFESLRSVVPIVLYSREKYDGTGYPKGLTGEKIPIGARILCLINAFEAIIIGRPYRDRSSLEEALEEILKNSGTQFDPKVVEVFLKVAKTQGFPALFQKALGKKTPLKKN